MEYIYYQGAQDTWAKNIVHLTYNSLNVDKNQLYLSYFLSIKFIKALAEWERHTACWEEHEISLNGTASLNSSKVRTYTSRVPNTLMHRIYDGEDFLCTNRDAALDIRYVSTWTFLPFLVISSFFLFKEFEWRWYPSSPLIYAYERLVNTTVVVANYKSAPLYLTLLMLYKLLTVSAKNTLNQNNDDVKDECIFNLPQLDLEHNKSHVCLMFVYFRFYNQFCKMFASFYFF